MRRILLLTVVFLVCVGATGFFERRRELLVGSSSSSSSTSSSSSSSSSTSSSSSSSGTGGACTSCTGTADADELCESFDGSSDCGDDTEDAQNCACTIWDVTADNDTAGTPDFNASHSGTFACTDKGDYALELDRHTTVVARAVNVKYAHLDRDEVYFSFYVNPVSHSIGNNSEAVIFMVRNNPGGNTALQLFLRNSSGNPIFKIAYYNGVGSSYASTPTITLNSWYKHSFHFKVAAGSANGIMEWFVDDTQYVNDTTCANGYTATRKYGNTYFGNYATSTTQYKVQFDSFKVDGTAMPSDCPE